MERKLRFLQAKGKLLCWLPGQPLRESQLQKKPVQIILLNWGYCKKIMLYFLCFLTCASSWWTSLDFHFKYLPRVPHVLRAPPYDKTRVGLDQWSRLQGNRQLKNARQKKIGSGVSTGFLGHTLRNSLEHFLELSLKVPRRFCNTPTV